MSKDLLWDANAQAGFPDNKRAAEDCLQRGENVNPGVKRAYLHTPHHIQEFQQESGLSGADGPEEGRWVQIPI